MLQMSLLTILRAISSECGVITYATTPNYMKGAMVNFYQLNKLGRMPFTVIHSTKPCPNDDITFIRTRPAVTRTFGYYRDVMMKLEVFRLCPYKTCIYIESDALLLKPLNQYCDRQGLHVPFAHWLDNFMTSTFMVFQPSKKLYDDVYAHVQNDFDMDAINRYKPTPLPCTTVFLNAALDDQYPKYFCNVLYHSPADVVNAITLLHFTSIGKPWHVRLPSGVSREHHKLWVKWHHIDSLDVCHTGA